MHWSGREWLHVSMYEPERFIRDGILPVPDLPPIPAPPPAQLYNIAQDPLERRDWAGERPDLVARLSRELESWFEDVEADRRIAAEEA